MKTMSRKMTAWTVAFLSLALANGAGAADQNAVPKAPAIPESGYQSKETKATEGVPARYNKASGIIGMEIRNQNDEHLGRVEDVVFDLNSERISYVVMATTPKVF